MNEADRGLQFISSTLTADASLTPLLPGGTWEGAAEVNTPPPYLVYAHQTGHDILVQGGARAISDNSYIVLVWGPATQYAAIAAAADEADKALSRKTGPAGADAKVLSCTRVRPLMLNTAPGGVQWRGLGGIYHLYIQPADMSLQ